MGVIKRAGHVAAAAAGMVVLVGGAMCQSARSTPEELIRWLTHQTEERRRPHAFSCGQDVEDRLVATSLAAMGERAAGPLEEALNSIEKLGQKSPFGGEGYQWVLVADAKVKGPASDERLRRMSCERKLAALGFGLDSAIALEQGITSHLTSSESPEVGVDCFRVSEPRKGLDQFILAWMRGDRRRFDESLGPRAQRSLDALLHEYTWGELWASYWKRDPGRHSAVGYLFVNAAVWGEPWVTLEAERKYAVGVVNARDPGLETQFKTSSGRDCGSMVIQFASGKREGNVVSFPTLLVDSPDISRMLRIVVNCASE